MTSSSKKRIIKRRTNKSDAIIPAISDSRQTESEETIINNPIKDPTESITNKNETESIKTVPKRRFIKKILSNTSETSETKEEKQAMKRKRSSKQSASSSPEDESLPKIKKEGSDTPNESKAKKIAQKAKVALAKITFEGHNAGKQPSNKRMILEGKEATYDEFFFTNSLVNDENFITTFLQTNPLEKPLIPNSELWKRIWKCIIGCYTFQITSGKRYFSGEDSCVASLLEWLIGIAPTLAKQDNTPFTISTSPIRRSELTIPDEDMSNFVLSADVIMKQNFELATKLLQFFTDLFYLNCQMVTNNAAQVGFEYIFGHGQSGHSIFSRFFQADTKIFEAIKDRILSLFAKKVENYASLHMDQPVSRELKNYSKLFACLFLEKPDSTDFRHISVKHKDIQKLPHFVKYSILEKVFSFAYDEKNCCKFLNQYLGLKGISLEVILKNQLKALEKDETLTEFDLSKLYFTLKASKKVMENNARESTNLKLSVKEFEMCKKFMDNIYDSIILDRSDLASSWDSIFGIKMIRKLRKFIDIE